MGCQEEEMLHTWDNCDSTPQVSQAHVGNIQSVNEDSPLRRFNEAEKRKS